MDIKTLLIECIMLLIGVASHVTNTLTIRHDSKKMTTQVKEHVNMGKILHRIDKMEETVSSLASYASSIAAENVALKKQLNRILSETKGIRYEDTTEPKHKEV